MFIQLRSFYILIYKKTILITGGNGYLASNLIRVLKGVECNIIKLTRLGKTVIPVDGICKIVDTQGNLQTPKIWEEILGEVGIVYHFAAQTSTYVANANPEKDFQANVIYVTSGQYDLSDEVRIPQNNPEIGYDWFKSKVS